MVRLLPMPLEGGRKLRGVDAANGGADPIGRLEEELGQLGDASGQLGEVLQVGE